MAQYNLGVTYAKGQGVAKDEAEGYKWWLLATAQGNERAKKHGVAESRLTREQIAEGQKLERNFRPREGRWPAAACQTRILCGFSRNLRRKFISRLRRAVQRGENPRLLMIGMKLDGAITEDGGYSSLSLAMRNAGLPSTYIAPSAKGIPDRVARKSDNVTGVSGSKPR